MGPEDAYGMANSVDPDQTAVWSGSTLFAQTCPSENLGYWKLTPYYRMITVM